MLLLLRRLLFRYFLKPRRRSSVNIPSFMPLQHVCRAGWKEGRKEGRRESALALQRGPRTRGLGRSNDRLDRRQQLNTCVVPEGIPGWKMVRKSRLSLNPAAAYDSISPFRSLTHAAHARQTAIRNRSDNDQFHPRSITHYIRGRREREWEKPG